MEIRMEELLFPVVRVRAFRKFAEIGIALVFQVLVDADFGGIVSVQGHVL